MWLYWIKSLTYLLNWQLSQIKQAIHFPKPNTTGRQIWPPHQAAKGPATPMVFHTSAMESKLSSGFRCGRPFGCTAVLIRKSFTTCSYNVVTNNTSLCAVCCQSIIYGQSLVFSGVCAICLCLQRPCCRIWCGDWQYAEYYW